MTRPSFGVLAVALMVALLGSGAGRVPLGLAAGPVGEKVLLDNDRVMLIEYVFPPGFRGEEHAAVADELAYVLDGTFTVVTRGKSKTALRPGEVEYASKGTVHYSLNETARPARVLVVLLKDR